jgi:CO/xanthine dehydrogenase FAD-binding subunit
MAEKHASPRVFFPRTVSEALDLANDQPDFVFWAGGTHLSRYSKTPGLIDLPRTVIALGYVEELVRASRSEHGLELGSMMSLDRLTSIGRSALPTGLPEALSGIGTRPLRCRATLGGHLGRKGIIGDLAPLLQILDSRIETRYLRERRGRRKPTAATRKIPVSLLAGDEGLRKGELITRVSIPNEPWNFGAVEKIYPESKPGRVLIFSALARLDKGMLSEWRMALSDGLGNILRDREMEVGMAGKPLPLSKKDLDGMVEAIRELTEPWSDREYERKAAMGLARGFMIRAGS